MIEERGNIETLIKILKSLHTPKEDILKMTIEYEDKEFEL